MNRPTFPAVSVNQRLPSGPIATSNGEEFGVGMGYSVTTPGGVTRPILPASVSANHTFPSGPPMGRPGPLLAVRVGNSCSAPRVVTRPIIEVPYSENHNALSGPDDMNEGA